jgi:hypothetical protein
MILPGTAAFKAVEPWNVVDLISRPLPKSPCWIEPSVLPKGAKMLFGGCAKVGKSMLLLEMARALATGSKPFAAPALSVPVPTKILLLEQEIGPWGLQKRAQTILAGESADMLRENFHGISQVRGFRLDALGASEQLAEWCHKVGANVLFLDPIGKLHTYDENDAGQINRLFNRLDDVLELCKDLGLSIVLSHHFIKPLRDPRFPLTDDQLFSPYNFRGSSKWYDDPDTLVTVNRLPGEYFGHRSATPGHKWWMVKSKWETRQGGDVPEYMSFSINRDGNLRVVYEEKANEICPITNRSPRQAPNPTPAAFGAMSGRLGL